MRDEIGGFVWRTVCEGLLTSRSSFGLLGARALGMLPMGSKK